MQLAHDVADQRIAVGQLDLKAHAGLRRPEQPIDEPAHLAHAAEDIAHELLTGLVEDGPRLSHQQLDRRRDRRQRRLKVVGRGARRHLELTVRPLELVHALLQLDDLRSSVLRQGLWAHRELHQHSWRLRLGAKAKRARDRIRVPAVPPGHPKGDRREVGATLAIS